MRQKDEKVQEINRVMPGLQMKLLLLGLVEGKTDISRHHGGTMKAPLKPPVYYSTIEIRCLRWALNWGPIMPSYAIVRICDFFLSNSLTNGAITKT